MKARENPFRVECLHQLRFRLTQGTLQSLLQKLEQQRWRGAIVGPHGSGKTTLLLEIIQAMEAAGLQLQELRLSTSDGNQHQQQLDHWLGNSRAEDILILDGAEQLTTRQWQQVSGTAAGCRGLLITSHRRGRLPTLYECRTSASLLEELIGELTGATPSEHGRLEIRKLIQRHSGNLRDCLRELYDCWPRR